MLLARKWLGNDPSCQVQKDPRHRIQDLVREYRLDGRERRLRVKANSILTGQTLNELQLRKQYGINIDRKSTRLNSSHVRISYAVFCMKRNRVYAACSGV